MILLTSAAFDDSLSLMEPKTKKTNSSTSKNKSNQEFVVLSSACSSAEGLSSGHHGPTLGYRVCSQEVPPEGGQILPWGAAAEAADTGPKVDKDAVEAVAQAVQEQSNLMSIIFQ